MGKFGGDSRWSGEKWRAACWSPKAAIIIIIIVINTTISTGCGKIK